MTRQTTQGTPVTALYARLSKDDEQQGDSVSIENQKRILETYARDNGLTNYKFFVDAADILGLKQNHQNWGRFSPIFLLFGHFSGRNPEKCHFKTKEGSETGTERGVR